MSSIVVFGGNGYVGQHIIKAALNRGISCISVSRSGAPQYPLFDFAAAGQITKSSVAWTKGDIVKSQFEANISGCQAAISTVGAFGSNAFMESVNGDGNINAVKASFKSGIPRFVFISTVENNLPSWILRGYFNGKRRAEQALQSTYASNGTILRPAFIYGERRLGSLRLPLQLVGRPLELLLSVPGFRQLRDLPGMMAVFSPPVAVEMVAEVAVAAAIGSVPLSILSVDDIRDQHRILSASA